jgi:hypothetical protein
MVAMVSILVVGFYSYSSSLALSLQSVIPHHKISDKKLDSDSRDDISSISSDTKSSDHFTKRNIKNNDENNNQGTDHDSNTDADLSSVESSKLGEQQQQRENGENVAPSGILIPETRCEQGSNCTDQHGLSDNAMTTASDNTTEDNTPFVLSLPFP